MCDKTLKSANHHNDEKLMKENKLHKINRHYLIFKKHIIKFFVSHSRGVLTSLFLPFFVAV